MDVMQEFSYNFGTKMDECGKKLQYTHNISQDILKYWDQNHKLSNTGLGCLVLCALVAFDLVDRTGDLIPDNTQGYLMANGADETTAKTIIQTYTSCCQATPDTNHCEFALKASDCFRSAIWRLGWTPDIKSILSTRRSREDCPDVYEHY